MFWTSLNQLTQPYQFCYLNRTLNIHVEFTLNSLNNFNTDNHWQSGQHSKTKCTDAMNIYLTCCAIAGWGCGIFHSWVLTHRSTGILARNLSMQGIQILLLIIFFGIHSTNWSLERKQIFLEHLLIHYEGFFTFLRR